MAFIFLGTKKEFEAYKKRHPLPDNVYYCGEGKFIEWMPEGTEYPDRTKEATDEA